MLTVTIYDGIDKLPKSVDRSELPNNGAGKQYASYLVMEHEGQILRVESSAMEPEDASFGRDLSWIPDAIRQAYEIGKLDSIGGCGRVGMC
jgi:hypothetical protein